MTRTDALKAVCECVAGMFSLDAEKLSETSNLMEDTPCREADLPALARAMSEKIGAEVDEERLFLTNLRRWIAAKTSVEAGLTMAWEFPWLDAPRRRALEAAVKEPGAFLTLGDMAGYVEFLLAKAPKNEAVVSEADGGDEA